MLARLGQGREAEVLAWADGYVIKLFWPEYTEVDARLEAYLAQQAWLLGAPAPRVADVLALEGRWGVVMEWLRGMPMSDYLLLGPHHLQQAAERLAWLHHRLHTCPAAQMPSQRMRIIRRIEASPLSPELRAALLEHLERLPEGSALCHGDLHPENVLVADEEAYAVDWSLASRGSPAADVARTVLLLRYSELPPDWPGRPAFEQQRRLFCQAYLAHYQRFAGLERLELEAWLPIVAAVRLGDRVPGEEARLLRLIERGLAASPSGRARGR
ncbi:aminoglycoside phosphotransferase [Meiothermus sp. QL-1]|uniref:phosphotransferase family protein n=1 Tax=Meiothermus sp. QL-1 TaxID=2058095 RepID=UPI000E0C97CB|nr:phosphotransferase [Meiothermus sp. QL-1]RDI96135.1 aminoglycoside phosphotransferase [Meiothermus sp. QL-1]